MQGKEPPSFDDIIRLIPKEKVILISTAKEELP